MSGPSFRGARESSRLLAIEYPVINKVKVASPDVRSGMQLRDDSQVESAIQAICNSGFPHGELERAVQVVLAILEGM